MLGNAGRFYDTHDGKRFLVVIPETSQNAPARQTLEQINVVLNSVEELKMRVPTK